MRNGYVKRFDLSLQLFYKLTLPIAHGIGHTQLLRMSELLISLKVEGPGKQLG
jgi:hypothetical protein